MRKEECTIGQKVFYMGEEIYHLANMPKSKYFTEQEDHMMEFDKNLVDAISEFLKSLN